MANIFPIVYYKGEFVASASVPFPYDDYGFLYGYGFFETVRIHNGTPLLFDHHWDRLESSAIITDIQPPVLRREAKEAVMTLIKTNNVVNATLNIYLTAGDRPVGTHRVVLGQPMTLMVLRPFTQSRANIGIHLGIRQESFQRIQLDQFKMLAYVKNILEKSLCDPYDDVLLYSEDQSILETPTANVFFIKRNQIITPKSDYILPGVTRRFLIDQLPTIGFSVSETPITVPDLDQFDEIFLTSSLRGIVLVDQMEHYPTLKSGPVSRLIQKYYNDALGVPTLPPTTHLA